MHRYAKSEVRLSVLDSERRLPPQLRPLTRPMRPASFKLPPTLAIQSTLRQLTDEIGGRIPARLLCSALIDWGVHMFKSARRHSVHTELFTISALLGGGDGDDRQRHGHAF